MGIGSERGWLGRRLQERLRPVRLTAAAVALAAAVAFAAIGGASSQAAGSTTIGIGFNGCAGSCTLDPQAAYCSGSSSIADQMFTGLTRYDWRAEKLSLDLASSYTVSNDLKTWTFTLRKGASWSDGSAITAGDVVYGIQRGMDPAVTGDPGCAAVLGSTVASATALDASTVQVQMKRPVAYGLALLSTPLARAVPQAVVQQWGTSWTDPAHIVVGGAYTESARTATSVTLVPNKKYYGAKPAITQVTYDTDQSSPQALANAYLAGQLDFVDARQLGDGTVADVKNDPRFSADFAQNDGIGTEHIVFNTAYGPTTNVDVRRALSAATDRGQIANDVEGSESFRTAHLDAGVFPDSVPGGAAVGRDFEVGEAHAYQAAAGADWPSSITVRYNPNPSRTVEAQDLKAQWEAAFPGLTVVLDPEPASVSIGSLSNPDATAQAPVTLIAWIPDYPAADGFFRAISPGGTGTQTRWNDDRFRKMINKAEATGSEAARSADYTVAEFLASDDEAAIAPLYDRSDAYVHTPRLTVVGDRIENWSVK